MSEARRAQSEDEANRTENDLTTRGLENMWQTIVALATNTNECAQLTYNSQQRPVFKGWLEFHVYHLPPRDLAPQEPAGSV